MHRPRRLSAVTLLTFASFVSLASLQAQEVPAPEDIFGFEPGTDYKLADYDQVHRYFQAIDRANALQGELIIL